MRALRSRLALAGVPEINNVRDRLADGGLEVGEVDGLR
jgi:hypothetical protein